MRSSWGYVLRVMLWMITIGLIFAVGACGSQEGLGQSHGGTAAPTEPASPADSVSSPVVTSAPSRADWLPPKAEILAAFAALQDELPGLPVFVPGTLPPSATIEAGEDRTIGLAPARGAVCVSVPGGQVQFLLGVEGDVGDLPGLAVGTVEGAEALQYSVLGGTLVQWSVDGTWYGVFGAQVDADVVVDIALGMKRI